MEMVGINLLFKFSQWAKDLGPVLLPSHLEADAWLRQIWQEIFS
jgi:hypothetical protein